MCISCIQFDRLDYNCYPLTWSSLYSPVSYISSAQTIRRQSNWAISTMLPKEVILFFHLLITFSSPGLTKEKPANAD